MTEKLIDEIQSNSNYLIREVFKVAFYIREPHQKIANAVLKAFERFVAFTPKNQRLLFSAPSGDWRECDEAQLFNAVSDRIVGDKAEINGSVTVTSAGSNIADFYFDYGGFALDLPTFDGWSSYIQIRIPFDCFLNNKKSCNDLIKQLMSDLPISFGYAGRALEGKQERKQKLAKRYRAEDIADVPSVAMDIGSKSAGAYWLTMYGGDLLAALNAYEPLRSKIPKGCRIIDQIPRRMMIFLSDEPTRGDRNKNESIDGYVWLSQTLQAIDRLHVPVKVVYFEDDDDLEDLDAQRHWHLRFLQ